MMYCILKIKKDYLRNLHEIRDANALASLIVHYVSFSFVKYDYTSRF